MLKNYYHWSGCVLLVAYASGLPAEESIPRLLKELAQGHPEVRSAWRQSQAGTLRARYANRRYPDPQIMVERMQGNMQGFEIFPEIMPEAVRVQGQSLRIEQPLPFPGKYTVESRLAQIEATGCACATAWCATSSAGTFW